MTHEVGAEAMPWETVTVAGQSFPVDYEPSLMHQWNMVGRLPVIAVPAGLGRNGLPGSVQVVARAFDDERAFRVAAAIERAMPPLFTPELRPLLNV